ncbi:uncharacterized protein LOC144474480 [Augochlora pura]
MSQPMMMQAFDMICDKLAPEDPYNELYNSLTAKLEEFYSPKPLEIAENYRFHLRKQADGEGVQTFVAALHKLSINCNFGNYLKTALRNQFVFGLASKRAQARLLETKDLDFEKAIQIAASMELSEKDATQLQSGIANVDFNRAVQTHGSTRCGASHLATNCTLDRNVRCKNCGIAGHLAKVCKKKADTKQLEEILLVEHIEHRRPYIVTIAVESALVDFEVDSGTAVTIMSREWIRQLKIPLEETVAHVSTEQGNPVDKILNDYKSKLDSTSSKIRGIQARLTLKENAKPIFLKSRTVPFRLVPLVEKEINALEKAGILEKVNASEWATPIVPVLKKNNTIRMCGDFSVTLNKHLVIDEHPLPISDELFAAMAGGEKLSKIDIKHAYLQMEIHPEDRDLLTLNTHKGLYRCTRLLYGIASAPAIWQRHIV